MGEWANEREKESILDLLCNGKLMLISWFYEYIKRLQTPIEFATFFKLDSKLCLLNLVQYEHPWQGLSQL